MKSRLPVVVLVLVLSLSGLAQADVPPTARVLSTWEASTTNQLHRDCGYSAPIPNSPGQSLWLFCDTTRTDSKGALLPGFPFRPGTFAARGPYTPELVPTGINHLPTPPGGLPAPPNSDAQQFLPAPTGLMRSNGQPCEYQASWAHGVARGPAAAVTVKNGSTTISVPDASKYLFIPFTQVCVTNDPTEFPWKIEIEPKRMSLAVYDASNNSFLAIANLYAVSSMSQSIPWQQHLFHPVFNGGFMYLHAPNCDSWFKELATCDKGRAVAARVPYASLSDGSAYRWKGASGFTVTPSSLGSAVDIIDATPLGTMAVDVHDFSAQGKGYLLLEQLGFGGDYRIWQAATPAGPWTLRKSAVMPCPSGPDGGCYHLWGHPELSTASKLLYSHYDQLDGFVRVTNIGTVPNL